MTKIGDQLKGILQLLEITAPKVQSEVDITKTERMPPRRNAAIYGCRAIAGREAGACV